MIASSGRQLDDETATIIKTRLPHRVQVIENSEDAISLLEDAVRLPHSTTIARLKSACDLIVDGEFQQTGKSTLIRAFAISTRKPKILKFTEDAFAEYDVFQILRMNSDDCVSNHLVPIEQCVEDIGGKKALVMPMYLCTIDTPPYLTEENVLYGLREVLNGLHVLHSRGIVHNDIKPSNILMDMHGGWHICDYGSCTTIDNRSQKKVGYTKMYIPSDLKFKRRNTVSFDYLLLIVTALDCLSDARSKFCSTEFKLRDVNEKISQVTNEELRALLLNLWDTWNT